MVKVCGITRLEDAVAAVRLGYDAVGFIFAPSPRRVDPDKARSISLALPPGILRVGVFLDHDPGEVKAILRFCRLDLAQFHGEERPEDVVPLGGRAIKTLRPRRAEDLEAMESYRGVFAFLLDTWDPHRKGGTGRRGDWRLASTASTRERIILAGGLSPGNVEEAVKSCRPYGVDVCSGVEKSPGEKDAALLEGFLRRAKAALAREKEVESRAG